MISQSTRTRHAPTEAQGVSRPGPGAAERARTTIPPSDLRGRAERLATYARRYSAILSFYGPAPVKDVECAIPQEVRVVPREDEVVLALPPMAPHARRRVCATQGCGRPRDNPRREFCVRCRRAHRNTPQPSETGGTP